MTLLKWAWFLGGGAGLVIIIYHVWVSAGWFYGAATGSCGLILMVQWLEEILLYQWKMKRVVTYVEAKK